MEKTYIEIDASPWMDEEGITTSVFLGDGHEPCFEQLFTYEELIDKQLEAHTVRNKLLDEDTAELFVKKLEEVAMYARQRFEEVKE